MKESRTDWKLRKLGCGIAVYAIYIILAVSLLGDNFLKDETRSAFVRYSIIFGPLVLWFVSWIVRTVASAPSAEYTKEIIEYLNKVAPIPEFEANQSDEEYENVRKKALLRRLRAAFAYEERKKGTPLDHSEKNKLEIMLNIREEQYAADEEQLPPWVKPEPVSPMVTEEAESLPVIESELREHFGKHGKFFTVRDKRELASMTPEGRLRRYNDMKQLLHEGSKFSEKTTTDTSAQKPTSEELDEVGIDEVFLSEMKEESKFDEYIELQKAKILVLYEHDPQKRDRRLKIVNNMAMRFRESKGW